MSLSSQPAEALDHRFFRNTGLVLVMGTLMAGAITLTLAMNMAETETTKIIASTIDVAPAASGPTGEPAGQSANVALR